MDLDVGREFGEQFLEAVFRLERETREGEHRGEDLGLHLVDADDFDAVLGGGVAGGSLVGEKGCLREV